MNDRVISTKPSRAIIMDLDGTLCDVAEYWSLSHNSFHVAATTKAKPNLAMVDVCRNAVSEDESVLIVTARPLIWKAATIEWLYEHDIPFDAYYCRGNRDFRPNVDVKRDLLADLWYDGYHPNLAYDDETAVCDMLESQGLRVVRIPSAAGR